MYKWHLALQNGDILPPPLKKLYEHPHVVRSSGDKMQHYAYGWVIHTTERQTKAVAHNGGNYIFFAVISRFVDEGVVLILMTNEWRRDIGIMSQQLTKMIFDADLEPQPISKPNLMARWREKFHRLF